MIYVIEIFLLDIKSFRELFNIRLKNNAILKNTINYYLYLVLRFRIYKIIEII